MENSNENLIEKDKTGYGDNIDWREDAKWTVYVHTSPSGKCYVGITQMNPLDRWKNGNGYRKQGFFNAIQKYGWDNFKHEIIAEHLTEDEACRMEITLIKELNAFGVGGYNHDTGGRYQFANIEDLTGQTINGVYVNKQLDFYRNKHDEPITVYDCICSCGNHIKLNNCQIKYAKNKIYCDDCKKELIFQKHIKRYQSKNTFEIIEDKLYIYPLKSDEPIICDKKYFDMLQKYTIRMEYKNNLPSRARCYSTYLKDQGDVNLEKLLFGNDFDYVIFKDSHYDYRKENLFFVSTPIFTFYHHLWNNKDKPLYLISSTTHKGKTRWFIDQKLYKKWNLDDKRLRADSPEELIEERNRLLNKIAENNEALHYVVSLFYCKKGGDY